MKIIYKCLLFSIVISSLFAACDDHQDRFDPPSWLGGSNLEVLEENEDYSIFLFLLKKSGFYDAVNTINYTLFVPDNDAFEAYFLENGITDTAAVSDDQAYQLMSLHVLVNPRSRYDLIYEIGFGSDADSRETEDSEYTSLFFKKLTGSIQSPYRDFPTYSTTLTDSVTLYTDAKYIPIWSKEYLEDIFVPASGSDYEFIYGTNYDSESELSHLAMNISNAQLLPNPENPELLGINTSTGFIYPISEVVKPLPTLEKYLHDNLDKYGLFHDLLQRFATYGSKRYVDVVENGETKSQEQYKKSYSSSIPQITRERGPAVSGPWDQFKQKDLFTAFIPQDAVLQNYLDTEILPTYKDIDSVPEITLSYLLRSHLNNNLVLLSQMEDGFFDNFGTPAVLTESDIESAVMCSNGPLYDVNKTMIPSAFSSITKELFFNKDYSIFLFMLESKGLISSLSTLGDEATFFASTNDELYESGIRYNADDESIEFYGINNKWNTMTDADLTELIDNHVTFQKLVDFSGEGFVEMNSGNFLHYDNYVFQGPENQFLDQYCTTSEVNTTNDGVMYHTSSPLKSRNYNIAKLLHNDTDEKYAETLTDTTLTLFSEMLSDNRLLNYRGKDVTTKELTPAINFLAAADKWTVFAPTNAAIREARAAGLIPTSTDSLQNWIYYHFVPDRIIFDDGDADGVGAFSTYLEGEILGEVTTYETLGVNNAKNNLQITDKLGRVITVNHSDADMLAQKGVVHKINTILRAW